MLTKEARIRTDESVANRYDELYRKVDIAMVPSYRRNVYSRGMNTVTDWGAIGSRK